MRAETLLNPAMNETDTRSAIHAHLMLGLVYDRNGDRRRAIEEWRMPKSFSLWESLSTLAWNQGRSDDAIEFLQEAIAIAPYRLENYFTLAWLYCPGTGRVDEAIRVYAKAATVAVPDSFEHYWAEGLAFRFQQQWALALHDFEQALKIDSGRVDSHRLAALAADKMGAYPLAIRHLRQAIALSPMDSCIHADLGDVYRDAGQFAEASRSYSEVSRLNPKNPSAQEGHASLGEIYFGKGFFDQAASEFRASIALSPDRKDYYFRLGQSYQGQGRIDDAAAQFIKLIELDPNDASARQALATLKAR
jgi:tetratricopeptide (TPR) repeat protein